MKYVGLYDNDKDVVTKDKLDAVKSTVPTKTSQLDNDSGFITSAPVTSVNTKTGAVELTASDVGAQPTITASGILKGDGAGGVSAAVANTDYATCTNLRNGDTEGSLRTLNSQPPDDAYTMGANAFAEGVGTRATRTASHAEGFKTGATGIYSHAEGMEAEAYGAASHAEGAVTIASHRAQHVQGEYNVEDGSTASPSKRGNYAHIVGNGTSIDARSNAHTLDWSGNAWFAGDVYVGSTSGTNKDEGSKKLITADEVPKGAVYMATLTAAGWVTSGAWKTQTVSVTGLKASYNAAPFVDVSLSGTDAAADAELAAAWLGISATAIADTAADSLTVKFPATVDTPTVNIPIRVTTYD